MDDQIGLVGHHGLRVWYKIESRGDYGQVQRIKKVPYRKNVWLTLTWRFRTYQIERMPNFYGVLL